VCLSIFNLSLPSYVESDTELVFNGVMRGQRSYIFTFNRLKHEVLIFKNSVLTSKKTLRTTIIKTNWLVICR
jgi:hypothetical protein